MKCLAVYNVKGGTGKTLVSQTIAVGLARRGKRVLLIDVDGQCNTTRCFLSPAIHYKNDSDDVKGLSLEERESRFISNYIKSSDQNSIVNVFDTYKTIESSIYSTNEPNLDILPSDLYLYLTDTKLRLSDMTQHNRLKRALRLIRTKYDVCVFDCSPVKSLLNVNVLYVDPYVIIPVLPEDDSVQGLALTLNEIKAYKSEFEDEELVLDYGILINMMQRTKKAAEIKDYLHAFFPEKMLSTTLNYQSALVSCQKNERKSLLDLKGNLVNRFNDLLNELVEKLNI